ncbi:serine hydrolase domain-containing protein [Streptomyces sp. NPDC021096]|uniref:serine hydrolase domain-containing protein n=1 Tax=Streptomyces sp. NPDC021096 TaxID=3154792 RepID=UPI00340AEBFF
MRRSSALSLAVVTAATAAICGAAPSQAASSAAGLDRTALDEAITVRPGDDVAGAVAQVYRQAPKSPGRTWRGASGDLVTGRKTGAGAHFRIGSIAKPMEAVVLLQLSAEGRVDLDETVQHYMPGLLPEKFEPITVRQLLNHTSGLPDDFEGAPTPSPDQVIDSRLDYYTFDQVIQQTLRPKGRQDESGPGPHFSPGTQQQYNSFGYRVAGKLIEELTGHPLQHEITTRILAPLKMKDTSAPGRTSRVPRPYLPGYLPNGKGEPVDVNEQGGNPSSMTSTTADLDRFISGLFDGRLLRPAQAAELRTVPLGADGKPLPYRPDGANCATGPDKGTACFSIGLMYFPLSDGSVAWGKTGTDLGYKSGVFATRDLSRRVVYAVGTASVENRTASAIAGRLAQAAFGG